MSERATFTYFVGEQADMFSFYRIPKQLFTSDFFKDLSCEAKVLYGLMLDRVALSLKNHWLDEQKRAYIYFSIEEIMELLNCGRNKAVRIMKELDSESGIGLIEKRRQGFSKPNIIYVKNFILDAHSAEKPEENPKEDLSQKFDFETYEENESDTEVPKTNFMKSQNETSRSPENKLHEVSKSNSNKTDINKTEYSDTNHINHKTKTGMMDRIEKYRCVIENNIDYLGLCDIYDPDEVDELVNLMVDVVCSDQEMVRLGKTEMYREVVASRFLSLEYSDICYVMDSMGKNTTEVRNIRGYLLTVLYNAPTTKSHFYKSAVNYDMYGRKAE